MNRSWLTCALSAFVMVAVLLLHAQQPSPLPPIVPPVITVPDGAAKVEQTTHGTRPAATIVERFDGLGVGFEGPQGTANLRNPSDNTLAVGPNHIVQIVNTRMAIFTKKGSTTQVLYGPVETNNVFKGFGGQCEARNNGDAVVRYDQLADRWLIVMPMFGRGPVRPDQPPMWEAGRAAYRQPPGHRGTAGPAVALFQPPPPPPAPPAQPGQPQRGRGGQRGPDGPQGPYSMCYAISTGPDPLGPYYRYEFLRPLFPDYPRPAIWPDGYYVPTSTGDEVDSRNMRASSIARRCSRASRRPNSAWSSTDVNFLNNADIDGKSLPPAGAPNIMMAAGGTQLKKVFEDDASRWRGSSTSTGRTPAKTKLTGPEKIAVAPYHYLCDGQLTNCVPQPGTDRRLDAQGDKIMARARLPADRQPRVDRRRALGEHVRGRRRRSLVRVPRRARSRGVTVHQQGTYAPDSFFRWMASPAIDRFGNIGIGYSFGGTPHFAGQRFAARLASDPLGVLTLREAVLVEGEASQNAMRWEDYTQTAIDPADDCTIWYVGDYIKKGAASYSTKIGAFRLPRC